MAKTVVGLFDNEVEAQRVRQALINQGYSPENIRVVANEEYQTGEAVDRRTSASGDHGVIASIKNFFHSFTESGDSDQEYYRQGLSRGGALLAVTVADERADSTVAILEDYGAVNVNEAAGNAAGVPGRAAAAAGSAGSVTAGSGRAAAIPIVEEELQVGKRQVQRGGVRVYSHVVETPVEEEIRLREEHVRIERNAVNRPASEADFEAFQEGAVELTETAEEPVIAKQARVVEEVKIGKDVSERTETVKDKLRRTEVEVEELPGRASAAVTKAK